MTIRDTRLDRLSETLTASERAVLVLRSWKEGKDEDPSWRRTMPSSQSATFNRYIGLMNGVNTRLGMYSAFLRQEVEKLSLRFAWLSTVLLWQGQAFEFWGFIQGATAEPVTQAEYDVLEAKAREEYLPVNLLAYVLTEHHDGFTEADLMPDEDGHYENMVTPAAWERVQREKVKEIAKLVAEGLLPGKGRGKALTVQAGAFYDRLAEPVPVHPPWGREYHIVPDGQADEARMHRSWREQARKAYEEGPRALVPHLPALSDHPEYAPKEPSTIDRLVTALKETLRQGVTAAWRQLRAVEVKVEEVAEEFEEDPCLPLLRHDLDHCRSDLEELHRDLQSYAPAFALEEPGEEELASVRDLVEREVRHACGAASVYYA